jgi:hypothetical protein
MYKLIDLVIKEKNKDEVYYWIRGTGSRIKDKYEIETSDQAALYLLQDLNPKEISWVYFSIIREGKSKWDIRRYLKAKGINVPIQFIEKGESWINDRRRLEDIYSIGLSQEKITYEMFDCSNS